jgi:N-acetyl-gamma-glutamyl-phosphate reductase
MLQMESKIKVGIVGAAGYTGGELLRILLHHPHVEIVFAFSKSNAGKPIASVHEDLLGETTMLFADAFTQNIDVLFLCVGHGEAKAFLTANAINDVIKIIDLSQDFRLHENETIGNRTFVYGLPELQKEKIKSAQNIANPGCFATAIQLALLPLAKAGLLQEAFVTGITGSTGAGQSFSPTSHFSWRANNLQAYKTLTHQHLGEIKQSLSSFAQKNMDVHFTPLRGDFTRGIFVTAQIKCTESKEALESMYETFYADQAFVTVSKAPIALKQVVNTNKCLLQLEKEGDVLVVHSIIDNLLKGASGQAVQNMNILFGLEETTGLQFKANYF